MILMGKPAIIVIAVLVLALIGYLGYSRMQPGGTNMMQQGIKQAGESMTRGSIKSLLGANKNITCKVTDAESEGESTVYIAGSKMRGDFTAKVEGKTMMSHMIQDDEYAYMWSDEDSKGTKFKLLADEPESSVAPGTAGQSQTENLDEEVDMNCSGWIPDGSKFKAPSNVQFTDLSQMMESAKTQGKTGTTAPKMDSSVCDQIEDADAKAQCQNALGN